ncbi:type III-A CRISPR-associated RAMP protein Csm4 [Thermovibrio sp.]
MSSYEVYKIVIEPKSYFTSTLPAYTIFGALCWAIRFLKGEDALEEFIEEAKEGKVLLSSAMPKVGDEELFFKPVIKPERIEKEDLTGSPSSIKDSEFRSFIKYFKKVRFIRRELALGVINRKIKGEKELAKELFRFWNEKDSFSILLEAIPHAKIDRILGTTAGSGELYFEEAYRFKGQKIKLFFFVALKNDSILNDYILPGLKLLEDWGIGGNKSIGFGDFSLEGEETDSEIASILNRRGKTFTTLSPVLPKDSFLLKKSYYNLSTYIGTFESGFIQKLWKPKLFYLLEGSTLELQNSVNEPGFLHKVAEVDGKFYYQYFLPFPLYWRNFDG